MGNTEQHKILAIDDNETNLQLLKIIINTHYPNYQFLSTISGYEGIEMAKKESPELILLDILMPEINGYEVCKILKNDNSTRHIPVIMVSALGRESSERIKGLDAGADSFISKPFQRDELRAQIDVAIRIKNAENALIKHVEQINEYQIKLKKLNSEIIKIEEKERRRIAENLHDSLGQTLSLAYMKLSSVQNEKDIKVISDISAETLKLINLAVKESRAITYDLCPPILYELGLVAAIKWKMEQIKDKHKFRMLLIGEELKIDIPKEYDIFLYRIISELLTNVIKHANATLVEIELHKKSRFYNFIVRDNGVGFKNTARKKANAEGGFGLMSIIERVESINGTFDIKSKPGKGTEAIITIPSSEY